MACQLLLMALQSVYRQFRRIRRPLQSKWLFHGQLSVPIPVQAVEDLLALLRQTTLGLHLGQACLEKVENSF